MINNKNLETLVAVTHTHTHTGISNQKIKTNRIRDKWPSKIFIL